MYSRVRGRVQPTNVSFFANTLLLGTAQLPRPVRGPTVVQIFAGRCTEGGRFVPGILDVEGVYVDA